MTQAEQHTVSSWTVFWVIGLLIEWSSRWLYSSWIVFGPYVAERPSLLTLDITLCNVYFSHKSDIITSHPSLVKLVPSILLRKLLFEYLFYCWLLNEYGHLVDSCCLFFWFLLEATDAWSFFLTVAENVRHFSIWYTCIASDRQHVISELKLVWPSLSLSIEELLSFRC